MINDVALANEDFGHTDNPSEEIAAPDKVWAAVFERANVGLWGPQNREERRRVEKVIRQLAKRGIRIESI